MAPSDPSSPGDSVAISSAGNSVAGSAREMRGDRETFGRNELAIILSHYDVGVVNKIQEFPRGSRKAPKLVLRTDSGIYLLKRRARGKDDAYKVAFCHSIQLHLAAKQFPMPHLIGTRRENNSMLQWDGAIYELFEYIKGTGYDQSLEATQDAGKTLGLFHKLLADFASDYEAPKGSYHNARLARTSLEQIPHSLANTDPKAMENPEHANRIVQFLTESYEQAAQEADKLGLADWPAQIVHSDWHPGNMLFRGNRVVAVIDYDAARYLPRVIDTANGALQFSMTGGSDDVSGWPDYLDVSRFKRFVLGYDRVNQLTRAELAAIPYLMIEALITESAIPIAATGSFARMQGLGFLEMIQRKIKWLQDNTHTLANVLEQ